MDKNYNSSDSEGETEDRRGINGGHVIVVGTNAAGDPMIHLTKRSSMTIRGDGYDVAAFLAAIKKWQLVVVKKDPGRSLAALHSLVIDQRYNMK